MAKRQESFDDVLGMFAERIQQTVRRPNIYRYQPLPQQELFHKSQAKGRILFGGNRGGKTYGGGADDVMILTKRHPYRSHMYPSDGPIRMRFIGVDFERGIDQTAVPLFAELIPPSYLKNGSWEDSYRQSNRILTLADGSTCSFMSYEQDPNKFQMVSLHHIHFDEEPPKPIFDESMMRLVDVAGTWTLSETPVQQLEWVQDELIEKAESGERTDLEVFYLNTLDNTNLPVDEVLALQANMTEEEKLIRLQGRYPGGSLVFPEFERKWPFLIPEESFTLTPEWAVYESMDHGYRSPTAWLWTAVHPDGSIVTFRSLYAKNVVVAEWAEMVKEMRQAIARDYHLNDWELEEMTKATVGDPAIGQKNGITGTTVQQEYAKAGVFIGTEGIVSARSGNQNIGLDKMHTYLRKRPARHPRGPVPWWQLVEGRTDDLALELKKARQPKQTLKAKEERNTPEQIRDKDNHAIDAAKYLFIVSSDLRPQEYLEDDTAQVMAFAAQHLHPVSPPPRTSGDVYHAMTSGTQWAIHGSGASYAALEE